uniref:Uncharacterized protein n=1 Tax=Anopheles culicifacies TaxID=139723 RepID=A0A182MRJ5_9DIPT
MVQAAHSGCVRREKCLARGSGDGDPEELVGVSGAADGGMMGVEGPPVAGGWGGGGGEVCRELPAEAAAATAAAAAAAFGRKPGGSCGLAGQLAEFCQTPSAADDASDISSGLGPDANCAISGSGNMRNGDRICCS